MKIRKAILTGGGRATRLYPITTTINKHLLPLANKPMIFHAIEKVVAAGVTDIFINVNPGETDLAAVVGDGGHWGVNITFFEQTGGPQGIAHVVKTAQRFIGDDPFIFYLSDNIFLADVSTLARVFSDGGYDCLLAFATVPDPERFGVPIFDATGKLVDVVEKPTNPPNNFAQTGIYFYGPKVFFEAFDKIKKSARGEYEISSIHSHFLRSGKRVGHEEISGWWKDTGKVQDLLRANQLLLDQLPAHEFVPHVSVVGEKIHVGRGTVIGEGVELIGPVMIGENCHLSQCRIGPYVTIGTGCDIKNLNLAHSIILGDATLSGPLHLVDSMIGKSVVIRSPAWGTDVPHRIVVGDKTVILHGDFQHS